jgi:hypothetical protein
LEPTLNRYRTMALTALTAQARATNHADTCPKRLDTASTVSMNPVMDRCKLFPESCEPHPRARRNGRKCRDSAVVRARKQTRDPGCLGNVLGDAHSDDAAA